MLFRIQKFAEKPSGQVLWDRYVKLSGSEDETLYLWEDDKDRFISDSAFNSLDVTITEIEDEDAETLLETVRGDIERLADERKRLSDQVKYLDKEVEKMVICGNHEFYIGAIDQSYLDLNLGSAEYNELISDAIEKTFKVLSKPDYIDYEVDKNFYAWNGKRRHYVYSNSPSWRMNQYVNAFEKELLSIIPTLSKKYAAEFKES